MTCERGICQERARLLSAFADASIKITDRLHQQLLATIRGDLDFSKHDTWIAEAREKRIRSREELANHVAERGCG